MLHRPGTDCKEGVGPEEGNQGLTFFFVDFPSTYKGLGFRSRGLGFRSRV